MSAGYADAQSGPPAASAAAAMTGPQTLPAQFLCYLACAGLAALANFTAGSILVDHFGLAGQIAFPIAVGGAYCLGMAVNFVLNRRFTFGSNRRGIDQARTFLIVALSGLGVTMAVAALARGGLIAAGLHSLHSWLGPLGTAETISRSIAIGVTSVYSFLGHKYLTFNRGIRLPLRRLVGASPIGE